MEVWATETIYLEPLEPDAENWVTVFDGIPDNSRMLGMIKREIVDTFIDEHINSKE